MDSIPSGQNIRDNIWKVIDVYFKDNPYFLTLPQLDSYNAFITSQIPKTIRQFNPIDLQAEGQYHDGTEQLSYQQKLSVTVGGRLTGLNIDDANTEAEIINDGSSVYIGRPMLEDRTSAGNISEAVVSK